MKIKKISSINIITLSIIIICFLSYFMVNYINYNFTIKKNYYKLEQIQSDLHLSHFDKILINEIDNKENLIVDYSVWNDTYNNFYNKDWMNREIVNWLCDYYNFSNVIVLDKNLKKMYSYKNYSNDSYEKIKNILSKNTNKEKSYFIKTNNTISLVSHSRIKNEKNEEYLGYLLAISDINNYFKEKFNKIYGYNLTINNNVDDNIMILSDKEMISKYPLYNIDGVLIGQIEIHNHRDIFNSLLLHESRYKLYQLILLIISLFVINKLVSMYIINPIKHLENNISNLDTKKYNYLEEKYKSVEINKLVRAFNALIYRILYIENQNERLISANKIDYLTKLYNKKHFNNFIKSYPGDSLSFIFIDIDNFKSINDYHGHEKGDLILKEIGKVIKLNSLGKSKGFRYGGEEIVIVYQDNKDIAYNVAENLRKIIINNESIQKYSIDKPITISCGIANYPIDTNNIEEAVNFADMAMYEAKKNGKNRTHIYSTALSCKKPKVDIEFNLDYIIAISNAIDSKIPFKENHSKFVSDYSYLVGKKMGFDEKTLKELRIGGYIHDIGKISIPDNIFLKNSSLSVEEKNLVTGHPLLGYDIMSKATKSQIILDCILSHHERLDGTGFPKGLKANEISIYSKIISVVNGYHTMISDLPYKGALSHNEAIKELIDNKETQFDSTVVDIFISLMD